jgi:hypothetical protein
VDLKEAEKQRREEDVMREQKKMEIENLEKLNNVRQELLKSHNDYVNQLRHEHQKELERAHSLSSMYQCTVNKNMGNLITGTSGLMTHTIP